MVPCKSLLLSNTKVLSAIARIVEFIVINMNGSPLLASYASTDIIVLVFKSL